MPATHPDVPPHAIARLRAICLDLPEAIEEAAWTGTRWRIRRHTFAHVLVVADGRPPAYAKAARTPGPATLLTFRASGHRLESPRLRRAPFFRPAWFRDIVGMRLDPRPDWDEIELLLGESYRLLAPRALAALVERFED